ncbi:MAG TPA: barstar family protein [Cellvibrionaceae bacterium]|nr:barstar family protein [Cellvibrionaceae bacterium]HMW48097.1 barstar family protein [Cellvibrionaceae bacterium]HMW73127.1 barstar family protein [Cellvibrionaceae bacterium]HMY38928.1 barstar family protein [Marinagarivorans sp.]HNG61227.1 barstar family protein [Cellvibrionaceae bacterium]
MQINVGSVESEVELQEVLARHLGFPEFYGKNWDAFWDAITGLVELPNQLEFIGIAQLQAVVPDACQKLRNSLRELNQEFPELGVEVIWS